MDEIDRKIIGALAADARRPLAEIAAAAGLSASAVNERIRRLHASGALRRLTVDVDPAALGLEILAFVWIALAPETGKAGSEQVGTGEAAFRAAVAAEPAICECHHVTGPWSYLAKVRVASLAELEAFLARLKARGFLARSETVIALSPVVEAGFVPKPEGA